MQPVSAPLAIPVPMELVVLLLLGILAAPFVLVWWLEKRVRDDDAE